jgi:metal-responsive CopG/Arc/MetJ family transcriptional regulator
MAKINVSLPDELLEEIDELAEELHRSRSGLVAEASSRYIAELQAERAARQRRSEIEEAIRLARQVAAEVPSGRDMTELIREDRDHGHSEGGL